MKKILSVIFVVAILATSISCFQVSAESDPALIFSKYDEIVYGETVGGGGMTTMAADLISAFSLVMTRSGTQLTIYAETIANQECNKVGMKYIRLLKWGSGKWNSYLEWKDIYNLNHVSKATAYVRIVPGGTYKATCQHYCFIDGFLFFNKTDTVNTETGSLIVL